LYLAKIPPFSICFVFSDSPYPFVAVMHLLPGEAGRRQGDRKQDFEWLEVLGRGMSGVCRKVRGKDDGKIMVVKQIDISFVTPEEYESATRWDKGRRFSVCTASWTRLRVDAANARREHHTCAHRAP
jgi:hypothetical protein